MQVSVLGPLLVVDGDRPVAVGGARLRALLVRLAAAPGRWVGAGLIADALWPDDPPSDQANALQSLVSRLRRALPSPALIESGPAGYRLAVAEADVDAARFEADLARARRGPGGVDGKALRAALELWRGPALADVPDLPFAAAWAARLDELRLAAIEDAIEVALTDGLDLAAADVVLELEDVVAGHPLRERPHGQLIRVLAATGRPAEALVVYEKLRSRLVDQLGADPSAELQALHLALLRGEPLPGAVVPAAPRKRPRSNLKPSLTSFVGRAGDVRSVRELLHRARLVTLTGPGGSGKTRLSVESAAGVEGVGAEGVWQVELAPVTDPGDLAMTALGAIGLRDTTVVDNRQPAQRDPLQRLVEAIDDRDVVLLLDNCEHVIGAAAELAQTLLGRCPQLTILATSREPLGIIGESLWPVKPLETASSSGRPAALQLFADRAGLVSPGFELDAGREPLVAEICRRLDGLPLAIELAAARLRTLPLEAVAQRLGDRFRLLTGGNRTALPRHQTLRAVVAWSWDLLTGAERVLAEQLSIFPGGATVEAAEALPGAGPDTPELLDALADKSLLVVVPQAELRYRMLETIREFGTEQLAGRGEIGGVRSAFAHYFQGLVERAEPRLRTAEQLVWMRRLELEHDNILAALRYATDAGDAGTAVRLGAGMGWYWTLTGHHEEAAAWLEPVLALPGDKPPVPHLLARMLYVMSSSVGIGHLPAEADLQALRSMAASIELADLHPLLTLLEPALGMLADDMAAVQAAVARNRAHPDPWARAMNLEFTAISAENAGDLETARQVLPEALDRFRRIGDRWGLATALGTQANMFGLDGDDAAAIETLAESQRLMSELRARDDEQYAIVRIALLRARNGELDAARAMVDQAMELAVATGTPHAEAFAEQAYGQLDRMSGNLVEARRRFERALDRLAQISGMPPQVEAGVRTGMIQLSVQEGDLDAARSQVLPLVEAVTTSRDMPVTAMAAEALAGLASASGDRVLAARLLGAGVALRGGEDRGEPLVRELIASLRERLGDDRYRTEHATGAGLDRDAALALMRAPACP